LAIIRENCDSHAEKQKLDLWVTQYKRKAV
jgi:hypothetical protein